MPLHSLNNRKRSFVYWTLQIIVKSCITICSRLLLSLVYIQSVSTCKRKKLEIWEETERKTVGMRLETFLVFLKSSVFIITCTLKIWKSVGKNFLISHYPSCQMIHNLCVYFISIMKDYKYSVMSSNKITITTIRHLQTEILPIHTVIFCNDFCK